MKIVEIFSSIEGEGIRAGMFATFVRTYGCNIRCSYCDSMYANEGAGYTEMTLDEIVHKCVELGNNCITLTGGEPLIQPEINELIHKLLDRGFQINVETNGTVDIAKTRANLSLAVSPVGANLFFTVDYKTPSSGVTDRMCLRNFTNVLHSRDVVKFVCGSEEDLEVMKDIVNQLEDNNCKAHIFVSPVFGQIEAHRIVEFLAENKLRNVRMQLQLHKFIWDPDMKGV